VNEAHNTLVVIDHKTGSMRDERKAEYMEQLELYGLAGLIKFPDIDIVSPRLWYLDHGIVYPDPVEEELEFTQKDKPRLIKMWDKRTKPMLNDTTYTPKPNHGCQWCDFSSAKGGACKY
jgi:RecB family exonuclease